MRLYRGVGWTIDTSGEYAATEEERNSQYPIAARGYAAFLLSKVVYNKKKNKFSFIASDDVLEREYFNHVLQDVLLPDREDEKLEYRFGYFSRSYYFNDALVELVKQKVEKFKAANNMPKESASQNILQNVLKLFSGDKEKYEKFMQGIEYITTSCGYKRLIDEIDKNITLQYKGVKRSYDVLAQYPDTFKHLGTYDSYRKG